MTRSGAPAASDPSLWESCGRSARIIWVGSARSSLFDSDNVKGSRRPVQEARADFGAQGVGRRRTLRRQQQSWVEVCKNDLPKGEHATHNRGLLLGAQSSGSGAKLARFKVEDWRLKDEGNASGVRIGMAAGLNWLERPLAPPVIRTEELYESWRRTNKQTSR